MVFEFYGSLRIDILYVSADSICIPKRDILFKMTHMTH